MTVRDVDADGAYLGGGACVLLQNVKSWTERNLFENVSTLYNCNIGWRFTVVGPHKSFGYNRLLDVQTNPVADQYSPVTNGNTWNQTAFSFESNAYFYNSTLRATANVNPGVAGATGIVTVVHMQDTAQVYFSEVHLYGENDTVVPGQNIFNLTSGSNHFTYLGDINFTPGMLTNLASGAFVTHWMDDWSYFNGGQNQFGNPVLFSNSIQLGTASWSHGAGGPTNPCTNGSLYSNTSGGSGSTLFACVSTQWVDIK